MSGEMTPEMKRMVREMFPPIHPAVVAACRKVVWQHLSLLKKGDPA